MRFIYQKPYIYNFTKSFTKGLITITTNINKLKSSLLNLDFNNKLINFKNNNALNIISPDLYTVYDKLSNGTTLNFLETSEDNSNFIICETNNTMNISEVDKSLQALYDDCTINSRDLYLAFCFVKWRENEFQKNYYNTPLLLIPINIIKTDTSYAISIDTQTRNITTNKYLIYKFKLDFGVFMPVYNNDTELMTYLNSIRKICEVNQYKFTEHTVIDTFDTIDIDFYDDISNNEKYFYDNNTINTILQSNKEQFYLATNLLNDTPTDYIVSTVTSTKTFDIYNDTSYDTALFLAHNDISFNINNNIGDNTINYKLLANIVADAMKCNKSVLFVTDTEQSASNIYEQLCSIYLDKFTFNLDTETINNINALKKDIFTISRNTIKDDISHINELVECIYNENNVLINYSNAVQNTNNPLSTSIYASIGKILDISVDTESIDDSFIDSIPNILSITPLDLHNYIYNINYFLKTINSTDKSYANSVWNTVNISNIDLDDTSKLNDTLTQYVELNKRIRSDYDLLFDSLTIHLDNNNISDVSNFLALLQEANYNTSLINKKINFQTLLEICDTLISSQNEVAELEDKHLLIFSDEIYNQPIEEILTTIQQNIDVLSTLVNTDNYSVTEIGDYLSEIAIQANAIITKLIDIQEAYEYLSSTLSLSLPTTINNIISLDNVLYSVFEARQKTNLIKDTALLNPDKTQDLISSAIEQQEKLNSLKTFIHQDYNDTIFTLDCYSLLQKLDTKSDFLGITKKSITKQLTQHAHNPNIDCDPSNTLQTLCIIKDVQATITKLNNSLTVYFNGTVNNNYEILQDNLDELLYISEFFDGMPTIVRNLMFTNMQPANSFIDNCNKLSEVNDVIIIDGIEFIINTTKESMDQPVSDIIDTLTNVTQLCDTTSEIYDNIQKFNIINNDYANTISSIQTIVSHNKLQTTISSLKSKLQEEFNISYEDIIQDSDTVTALSKIITTNKIIDLSKSLKVSELSLYNSLLNNKFIESLDKFDSSLFLQYINNLNNLRSLLILDADAHDLSKCYDFVNSLLEDINVLPTINVVSDAKHKCADLGLLPFISLIEDGTVPQSDAIDIFIKCFYTKWIQEISKLSDISDYDTITKNINLLSEHNNELIRINIAYVHSALSHITPILSVDKPNRDEVNTLLDNILTNNDISIYNIFNLVPNLLIKIKRCFIVTYDKVPAIFDYELYNFDLCIMDNCHNISLQPAISSLARCRTAIFNGNFYRIPVNANTNLFSQTYNTFYTVNMSNLYGNYNYTIGNLVNRVYYNNTLNIYNNNYNLQISNLFVDYMSTTNEDELLNLIDVYDKTSETVLIIAFTTNHYNELSALLSIIDNHKNIELINYNDNLNIKSYDHLILSLPNFNNNNEECLQELLNNNFFTLLALMLQANKSIQLINSNRLCDIHTNDEYNNLNILSELFEPVDEMFVFKPSTVLQNVYDYIRPTFSDNFYDLHIVPYNNLITITNIQTKNSVHIFMLEDNTSNNYDYNIPIVRVISYYWLIDSDYKKYVISLIQQSFDKLLKPYDNKLISISQEQPATDNYYDFEYYVTADLYNIEPSSNESVFIANAIAYIVKIESPIHIQTIYKKICTLIGYDTVTPYIQNNINDIIERYLSDFIYVADDFCFNVYAEYIKARIPRTDADIRLIEFIHLSELSNIMYTIAKKSFGITIDDLFETTCYTLKYKNLNSNIITIFELAVLQLNNNGLIRIYNNKINII